jgi:hypothetical protein
VQTLERDEKLVTIEQSDEERRMGWEGAERANERKMTENASTSA